MLAFSANFINLLNQRAVTAYWGGFSSNNLASFLTPLGACGTGGATVGCNLFDGAAFYQAAETGYNPQAAATANNVVLNSHYGWPNLWQASRNIRLGAQFTF